MHEVWKMLQLMRCGNEGKTLAEFMATDEVKRYGNGKTESEEKGS